MENVPTSQSYTWLLSQIDCKTNRTKILTALTINKSLILIDYLIIHSFYALRFKAWQAFLFVNKSSTQMIAAQNFVTTLRNQSLTLRFFAYLLKSYLRMAGRLFYFFSAESTFSCILIILSILTCHSNMIGESATRSAKVFLTTGASYSELCHMICRLP